MDIENWLVTVFNDLCTCGSHRRPGFSFLARKLQPVRPIIMLVGDSITQRAFLPGQWAGRLAAYYDRTADIQLRGYSGYNSKWLLALLPSLQRAPVSPILVIVQVGSNDCVRAPPVTGHDPSASRQHVPVVQYTRNLIQIVRLIRTSCGPSTKVLLMAPPPIHDPKRKHYENPPGCAPGRQMLWEDANLLPYVEACKMVSKGEKVPLVNLYQEFIRFGDWSSLMNADGLHPNANGGELIGRLVMEAISTHFPTLQPAPPSEWREAVPRGKLPLDFPDHQAIDPKDPEGSISRHRDTASLQMGCMGKGSSRIPSSNDLVNIVPPRAAAALNGGPSRTPLLLDNLSPREDDLDEEDLKMF